MSSSALYPAEPIVIDVDLWKIGELIQFAEIFLDQSPEIKDCIDLV